MYCLPVLSPSAISNIARPGRNPGRIPVTQPLCGECGNISDFVAPIGGSFDKLQSNAHLRKIIEDREYAGCRCMAARRQTIYHDRSRDTRSGVSRLLSSLSLHLFLQPSVQSCTARLGIATKKISTKAKDKEMWNCRRSKKPQVSGHDSLHRQTYRRFFLLLAVLTASRFFVLFALVYRFLTCFSTFLLFHFMVSLFVSHVMSHRRGNKPTRAVDCGSFGNGHEGKKTC